MQNGFVVAVDVLVLVEVTVTALVCVSVKDIM